MKPKLLLHSCCGPCSTAVIERLLPDFDVTVFFYNPNILPKEEYELRLKTQKELLEKINIPLIVGDYDTNKFKKMIKGLEQEKEGHLRCYLCYKFRIEETQKIAEKLGFEYFTTTLSVSPHKNATWINEIGNNFSNEKVKFLESNFKKQDGFKRSIQLSKKYNLYRQNYCGCTPIIIHKTNNFQS